MANYTLTLEIPEEIYQNLQQQAVASNHSVEDIILQKIEANSSQPSDETNDKLPADLEYLVEAMKDYDDTKLWRAARSHLSLKSAKRLQSLNYKYQREGSLTLAEEREKAELLRQYQRSILIRAQAAFLLKERGHDISELGPKS